MNSSKFYTFGQNNSGGNFNFNESAGITHHVVIEALNAEHARKRAENIGLYFDGVESGVDCPCCGDRWYIPYGEGDEEPKIYNTPVAEYTRLSWGVFPKQLKSVAVHYLDGRIEWYD